MLPFILIGGTTMLLARSRKNKKYDVSAPVKMQKEHLAEFSSDEGCLVIRIGGRNLKDMFIANRCRAINMARDLLLKRNSVSHVVQRTIDEHPEDDNALMLASRIIEKRLPGCEFATFQSIKRAPTNAKEILWLSSLLMINDYMYESGNMDESEALEWVSDSFAEFGISRDLARSFTGLNL